jgi:uncharacterized phiE125 gp8 family phage protein
MSFKVTQVIDSLPFPLAVAKSHLRYLTTAEDDNIQAYIQAAVDYAENRMWRKVTRAKIVASYDGFPDTIEVPRPPLVELHEISYRGEDGFQVLDPSLYRVNEFSEPAQISPASSWPHAAGPDSVRIEYTAGYAVDQIPAGIIEAIQLLVGTFFTARASVIVVAGTLSVTEVPVSANVLLDQYSLRVPV